MSKKPKLTRQAKSIAIIRADRRAAGLCLWCGNPSPGKLVCSTCRPSKIESRGELSAIRRAAAMKRWHCVF